MSLFSRMLNVFASPAEAFEDIKDRPVVTANWLGPALLIMCVGWFAALLVFSQDNLKHQMKEMREKAIQKQMEKQHKSQEEIDKIIEATDKFGNIPAVLGGVFGPIFFAWWPLFVWGLIFWLIANKAFGAHLPYMKAVEAVGLAAMIDVLDGIVRALLIVAMGNLFASPSLALLVKNWDPTNPMHALLAYFNIMTFWLLAVRAIGLAKLAKVSFARAAAWVFGVWLVTSALIYGVSTGLQQVANKMGGAGGG
jgi:predicted DNA repair protein MutK